MQLFDFRQGTAPLLVSMPHVGLHIPDDVAAGMTDQALGLPDTDWHINRLYNFLDELGASVIAATHSRYVVDLNRPPDGASLYPGRETTGLCPDLSFDGEPLYGDGAAPDDAEIARRVTRYWRPYHAQIASELARIRDLHGHALLWDAHSIRSEIPRLFVGRLPDFNLGNADGAACDRGLADRVMAVAEAAPGFGAVLNGRFKGGYITRHYGDPARGTHAIQLELSQRTYMDEAPPFSFDKGLAEGVRPVIRRMLDIMLDWTESGR